MDARGWVGGWVGAGALMLGYLVACGAVAPGVVRASGSTTRRITAGAVLTVVAVGVLVAAAFANLEPPT